MLTEKDKMIIKYLKEHGETEFKILHKEFYNHATPQYCRVMLARLIKWDLVKVKKCKYDSRINIYYVEGL
jgi:hypothetical protein